MPTRILVVGGGGREHALAWKLAGEPGVNEVFVAPGSAAIGSEPRVICLPDVDPLDPDSVVAAARAAAVELVVVGPEAPLAAGVADACAAAGIAVFGPSRAAARIETSKAFCHEVAESAGVRMARAGSFDRLAPALSFAAEQAGAGRGLVVKADGLAGGKGVTMCASLVEAEAALEAVFAAPGGEPGPGDPAGRAPLVVVEERLYGLEASVIALCDGRDALALPAARDHKRLADDDGGPNTGGMGAYSPLPDGPVLLECNARFGDPETQVILPRLAVPLGPLLRAAAHRELAAAYPAGTLLPALPGAAVGIVLASAGYPDRPRHGDIVRGIEAQEGAGHAAGRSDGLIFQSGTSVDPDGRVRTNGGRVLTAVGLGTDLEAARATAEDVAAGIDFDGLQRRHDIALRPPPAAASAIPAGARA